MKRIAFELDRPAIDRCRDQRDRTGAARHGRGVVKKFSWNRPLGALGERDEVHLGRRQLFRPRPASAIDAPISFMKSRRDIRPR